MIYHKTLRNIRKKYNLSQEEFAQKLNCTEEHIAALERDEEKAAPALVDAIRHEFDLHIAPITNVERETLMSRMHNWKLAIDYGDMETAVKLKPEFDKAARLSFSPSTENYYTLYAADYYRLVGDTKAYEESMDTASQLLDQFGVRHHYNYQRLVAAREHDARRYIQALKGYKESERLDWESHWGDVRFFYGYGICLSDMGHAASAVVYLRKAQHHARSIKLYKGRPNRRFDVHIDCALADNLSKIGQSVEALAILDKRLDLEMKYKADKAKIGFVYQSYGNVYRVIGNCDEALKFYEKALPCFLEGSDVYKDVLYRKALTLVGGGKIDEALHCIDTCLSLQPEDIRRVLLEALRCSITLADSESLAHMEDTVMPELLKYGQYEETVKYLRILRKFYDEDGEYRLALKSADLALEIQTNLLDEIRLGGLL